MYPLLVVHVHMTLLVLFHLPLLHSLLLHLQYKRYHSCHFLPRLLHHTWHPDTKHHIAVQVLPHRQFSIKGFVYLGCDIIGPNSACSDPSLPTPVDNPMRTGSSARTHHRYTIRNHLALVYNHPTTLRNFGLQKARLIFLCWPLHGNRHVRILVHALNNVWQSVLFLLYIVLNFLLLHAIFIVKNSSSTASPSQAAFSCG